MNNNLKDLYDEVFTEIFSKIKDLKIGILYQTIQIILLENRQNIDQEITQTFVHYLGIKPNANEDEDNIVVSNVRKQFSYSMFGTDIELGIVKQINSAISSNESERKKMEELKWIVIVACAVVGAYACIQYLENQNKKNSDSKKGQVNRKLEDLPSLPYSPPIPAVLCLIVPSNIVSNLRNGSSVNIDGLSNLIDKASYFLCARKNDADSKQQKLSMADDESISPDSNREVYVRVKINDGQNLIDKQITYLLKSNLPVGETFIIEKIACLRSLSGLESFNRV